MAGGIPFPLQHGGMSYRFRYMWGIGRSLKHTDSGAIRAKRFRDAPIPWANGEMECQEIPSTTTVSQAPGLHAAHSK